MSHITTYCPCPEVQYKLNNQFTEFDPTSTQDAIGVALFLKSALNTNGFMQSQLAAGNGKIRQVQLRYQPRFNEDVVEDSAAQVCKTGEEAGDLCHTYDIDEDSGVRYAWKVTLTELVRRCEDNAGWWAQQVQKAMDVATRKMNRQVIQQIALNFGKFAATTTNSGGVNGPAVVTTRKSGGDYDPAFFSAVKKEYKKMNYAGAPFIFGDNLIDDIFTELQAMCCANDGMDISRLAQIKPIVYMRDEQVETEIGTNEFIGLVPGAAQLITYNQFEGSMNVYNDDTYAQGTIIDPKTGIMWDYSTQFDCGTVYGLIKLAFKPIFLPADVHHVGDKLSGVNWVNNFKVVNP